MKLYIPHEHQHSIPLPHHHRPQNRPPREIEIWFVEADGRLYILAEHGYKVHWIQNILANPRVNVRIGDQQWDGVARVLDPDEDTDAYLNVRQLSREKYGWAKVCPSRFGSSGELPS